MSVMLIAILAVVFEVICAAVCLKQIIKDIRQNIHRHKLTRWASQMLQYSRQRAAAQSAEPMCSENHISSFTPTKRPVIAFQKPSAAQKDHPSQGAITDNSLAGTIENSCQIIEFKGRAI